VNEKIKYFFAGIFIGISELLPGISGATVALMFGVYENILNFLKKFQGFSLILPLLLGMIISIFGFSNFITYLYANYSIQFNFFISVLMLAYGSYVIITIYIKSIRLNENNTSNLIFSFFIAIITGLLISSFNFQETSSLTFFAIIIFGFIACSFLLFPGISGSAFLISVGAYELITSSISISSFNFSIILSFGLGMLLALILMPRLISMAYKRFGNLVLIFFAGVILMTGLKNILNLV
tara:strand:+ start:1272 stop:1988 length:717 start_codon:yes stop_codon:yes gene_type:complete